MTDGGEPRERRWLRLLLPVLVLAAIAWWVDLGRVTSALLSLSGAVLVAALLLATADRGLMAFKWWQLLRAAGRPVRFPTALRIYYQASASGRVIPFPLGTDMLRAYLASQAEVPEGDAVSSIVVERLIAMFASALPALVGLLYLARRFPDEVEQAWFFGLVGVGLLLALGALTLILLGPAHRLARSLYERIAATKRLPRRLERLLGDISRSLLLYGRRRRTLAVHAALAVGEQLLQYAKFAVLAYGMGIAATSLFFLAVIALALFVRRIAGVIEQWGVGEGSAVVVFALLGLEPELAVALLVANFAVSTVAVLPGALLFYTHPIRLDRPVGS